MRKRSLIFKIVILVILVGFLAYRVSALSPRFNNYFKRAFSGWEQAEVQDMIEDFNEIKTTETTTPPPITYLNVPFICQAPLETEENWIFHEESCEEAATLMAYIYETKGIITKEEANEEILKMIDWQIENFGKHTDIYAEQVKEFITGYYELPAYSVKVIYDASIKDIKKEISAGHPVIVPITGEILRNPHYPHPGYHMLVAIGYTEEKIITNDNGTRKGDDYSYDTKIFKAAMEDAGGDVLVINID